MSASQSTSAIPEDVIPPAVSSSGTQENDVPAADDLANGELLQGAELPLSLPPQTRAGAPSQDTISLTLTMDWAGGDIETRPDSVTVRLAASNQPIMQRDAVLCADTQWTYTWRDLPAKDAAGNAITYYTNPVPLPNTQFETQYLDAIESIWIPADQFENGEQYVIADVANYAMGLDSGNAQSIRAARVFQTTARINGVDIKGISTPESAFRWRATQNFSPAAFYLQNANGAYLCQYIDSYGHPSNFGTAVGGTANTQTLFTYTDQKTLKSNADTWAMHSGVRYMSTTDVAQATPLTLYRQVPIDKHRNITALYTPPPEENGGKVDYHKRIDYLNDGGQNPDTTLTGKDAYRLYLDVAGGIEMPADVVLVLDVSGSMDDARMKILNDAVMGTDGFAVRFLKAHSENNLSIVCFWGAKMPNWNCGFHWAQDNPIVNGQIKADQDVGDATIYQGWMDATGLTRFPQPLRRGIGGTNYGAGLYQAQQLLKQPHGTAKSTQYLLFMSDGVPTHALSTQRLPPADVHNVTAVFGQGNEYVPQSLRTPSGIYRYGSGEGGAVGVGNIGFCKEANKALVKKFAADNPKLNIFSVGVGQDDPTVLQYL
ncbi:MAG: Cna B-type domain-containing protein, partial [Ruthenibacterium sp.]